MYLFNAFFALIVFYIFEVTVLSFVSNAPMGAAHHIN